jgi:hypothetical protein
MTRYFFDVMWKSRAEYDFSGSLFPDPQEAFHWAQLLALDLEVAADEQEFVGTRLGVRGIDGRELFSIPIGQAEMAGA